MVGNDLKTIGALFDIACDAEFEVGFVFHPPKL